LSEDFGRRTKRIGQHGEKGRIKSQSNAKIDLDQI